MPPDGTPPGIAGKAESEKNSDAAGDVNGGRDEAVFPVVEFPVHAYNIASFREAVKPQRGLVLAIERFVLFL